MRRSEALITGGRKRLAARVVQIIRQCPICVHVNLHMSICAVFSNEGSDIYDFLFSIRTSELISELRKLLNMSKRWTHFATDHCILQLSR